jgi:hypothetical protein
MDNIFDLTLWTDTEKAARIDKLRHSEPIEISGKEVPYSEDLKQYRKNAFEYGKTLRGEYQNKDTGANVTLYSGKIGGIKEVLEHDYKDIQHLQSVAAIPKIIEESIFIAKSPNEDTRRHPEVKEYDYYVCGLKIDGTDYTVKAVFALDERGNRYYDHKLTQIEKGKLLDLTGLSSMGETHPTNQVIPLSDHKDKRLFSILQIRIPNKISGIELSPEQRRLLANGDTIKLENITDNKGRSHAEIHFQWDIDTQKLRVVPKSSIQTENTAAVKSTPTLTPHKRGRGL